MEEVVPRFGEVRLGSGRVRPPRGHRAPPPTLESARAPCRPVGPGIPFSRPNSNQMVQVENHRLAGRAGAGDPRRMSQARHPPPHEQGPGMGAGRWGVAFQGAPRGSRPCPGPTFSRPREPEGIPSRAFPVGANGTQCVCVCGRVGRRGWRCLCGLPREPEREISLHLTRGLQTPCPWRNRESLPQCQGCSLHGPAGPLGVVWKGDCGRWG